MLRIRGAHETSTSSRRNSRIQWAEGTVDNEGLGRKKSKVCCIYHKERAVGESSDESSSDSDSDSGKDGNVDGRARMGKGKEGEKCGHEGHAHGKGKGKGKKGKRRPSPNAYERMPKYDIKSLRAAVVDKAGI